MPILRDIEGWDKPVLIKVRNEGDNRIFTHVQEVDHIARECHLESLESDTHNLSFKGRKGTFEKIASIPEIEFLAHKEFLTDPKSMVKWLKGDGKKYRTSRRRI